MKAASKRHLRAFLDNTAGIAAVEFALIAPVMISMYFGSSELCNLLLADRKVTNVTAATTDLVAQEMQISDQEMTDIFDASSAVMEPYSITSLQIVVTSVVEDNNNNVTVAWSDGYHRAAYAVGTPYVLPNGIISPGGSVIVTEVYYQYVSPIGQFWTNGFNVNDKFYQKPRRTAQIARVS